MKCPDCQNVLKESKLNDIIIDVCEKCEGKWIEKRDLLLYENKKDEQLKWLDFKSLGKQTVSQSNSNVKKCPCCMKEMQSLKYSPSKVIVDQCKKCEGIWIRREEMLKIMSYCGLTEAYGMGYAIFNFLSW